MVWCRVTGKNAPVAVPQPGVGWKSNEEDIPMRSTFKGAAAALVLFVLLVAGGTASAAPLKIATVNLKYILTNSKVAHSAQEKLQAKADELRANVQKEQDKYNALKDEIEKKKTVWSQDVLQGKLRDLQKIEEFGKIVARDSDFELKSLEKKLMGPILDELGALIEAIGKRDGYTLIMDDTAKGARSGILYADETLDISDMLLKELDERMAKKK